MRIDEIKSSPSRLRQMASKLDALVGIEFELIVKDAIIEGGESEPDYDSDESVITKSWDALERDIRNFFVGDYNTRREVDGTLAQARRDFDSFVKGMWETHVEEEFEDWKQDQTDPDSVDKADFRQATYDEWFDSNETKLLDEWTDWENLAIMSGWFDKYSLSWPNWTEPSSIVNNDSIAQSFAEYVNMDVGDNTTIGSADSYDMKEDSSISPGDTSTEAGVEFVSPPLSLDEAIEHIQAVKRWAQDGNAYTNRSCGLHINVSLPYFSQAKLDYIKLILFSADQEVLKTFAREANNYAKSATDEIKRRVKTAGGMAAPGAKLEDVFNRMRQKMLFDASRLIHTANTDKYTSINIHHNRVEFRSPGGDWLDMDIDAVINAVVRFVVALDIAMDPDRYQEEYAKKFYKLISPNKTDNALAIFSLLQARSITTEQFKKYWAQMIARMPDASDRRHDMANRILNRAYDVVDPSGNVIRTVYAATKADALVQAKEWARSADITDPIDVVVA
jgi:hypothetical protein